MKRVITSGLILLVLVTLAAGCGNSNNSMGNETRDANSSQNIGGSPSAEPPNTYLPQVMIDDVVYYLCGGQHVSKSDGMQFFANMPMGEITSIVPLTQKATVNGQANFNTEVGAVYAKYDNWIAVMWNGAWELFVTEEDLLDGFMPSLMQPMQNAPEKAPSLDVALTFGNSPEQRVQAIQLTTSWNVTYADGTGQGYEADSPHALHLPSDAFSEATLTLGKADGEIELQFHDNYPPKSVTVQRWNAEYASVDHDISSIIDSSEPVEVNENMFHINNQGANYIYEIHATWAAGNSYYTFRINCSPITTPNTPDSGPIGLAIKVKTEHYEYKNADTLTDISADNLKINGHPNKNIEQRINQMLKELAWIYEDSPTEEELEYEMRCDYVILAERYMCVSYYLQYYSLSAAHPWRSLDCKTIDLEVGWEIALSDIMTIDERLLQKLVGRKFDISESDIVGVDDGVLDECDYDDFYRQISKYKNYTLSENSIGFIVEVPHYIGDYWVLVFPYDSVSELLQPWFAALVGKH